MVGVNSILAGSPIGRIVLVTEAQQTQTAITALIALLLVIAAMLAVLTLWYWRHTNPRRRMQHLFSEVDQAGAVYELDLDQAYYEEDHDGYGVSYEDAGQQNYR